MEKAQDNNQRIEKEKPLRGAMIIFYKKVDEKLLFLVVKNAKTGNVSFPSGAEEPDDELLIEKTAQREIKEELGLAPDSYHLVPTGIKHEFIFNSKKKERAGRKACYDVYLADVTSASEEVGHTPELKSANWMTADEADSSLTFPELQGIFRQAIKLIK